MPLRYLITGATGFVGGHVAEACASRGLRVSAIARESSDVGLLADWGIVIHRGELTNVDLLRRAVADADVVVHCAAKVGDKGPVDDYRPVNVEALRSLLEVCKGKPLHRFVQMSSLGVYEARHHYGTTESEPLGSHPLDGYSQTKAEADELVLRYHREAGVPVVVLRPGFVYGPRDRTVLPKLIQKMTTGKVHYLGADRRALNTIFVGNLVDAVFLAVDQPAAVGQAYNLTDGEFVSKQRFFDAVADGMGLKRSKQVLPRFVAALVVRLLKRQMRFAIRNGRKPWLSPARLKFVILNLDFSIDKAKRELGYQPRVNFDEGMRQTIAWYQNHREIFSRDLQASAV